MIPNGKLSRQRFLNLHGQNHPYAELYNVRVSEAVDPIKVASLQSDAVKKCDNVLNHPAPSARLKDASSIPYTFYVWVYFKDYLSMFEGREEVYQKVHAALEDAGLQVAAEALEVRNATPKKNGRPSKS